MEIQGKKLQCLKDPIGARPGKEHFQVQLNTEKYGLRCLTAVGENPSVCYSFAMTPGPIIRLSGMRGTSVYDFYPPKWQFLMVQTKSSFCEASSVK